MGVKEAYQYEKKLNSYCIFVKIIKQNWRPIVIPISQRRQLRSKWINKPEKDSLGKSREVVVHGGWLWPRELLETILQETLWGVNLYQSAHSGVLNRHMPVPPVTCKRWWCPWLWRSWKLWPNSWYPAAWPCRAVAAAAPMTAWSVCPLGSTKERCWPREVVWPLGQKLTQGSHLFFFLLCPCFYLQHRSS